MIYLQIENKFSLSFFSKGNALNWLSHQGVFPFTAKLETGEQIEIFHKNGKIINIQIIDYCSSQETSEVEKFLNKL